MYIFDDLKELNRQWKRWLNIKDVLKLTHTYRKIEIKEPIVIDDIYIINYRCSLVFFVKKDNWKKYIGVRLNENACYNLYKSSDLKNAAEMLSADFEDAVQMCCASRIKADYIVTRNIRDFQSSKIIALKPSELLERI